MSKINEILFFAFISFGVILSYENYPNHENYQIIDILGKGAFGTAFKVYNVDDNQYYVIKRIKITQSNEQSIKMAKNEVEMLKNINSSYVIKYYDSFIEDNCLHIIMEYCPNGDLRKFITAYKLNGQKPIEKDYIIIFIHCISEGLKELHKNNIIHRDIKPENLFLTEDMVIKIGDLGISKQVINESGKTGTYAGTPIYMAPEIRKGLVYDNKVDIFSFGLVIYELCTFEFGYDYRRNINKNIYGPELQTLINSMLQEESSKRPSAKEISEIYYEEATLMIIKNIYLNKILNDPVQENKMIEENIESSLSKIPLEIMNNQIKLGDFHSSILAFTSTFLITAAFNLLGFLTGGITNIAYGFAAILVGYLSTETYDKFYYKNEFKISFISQNYLIVKYILEDYIIEEILPKVKFDKHEVLKNNTLYIYNEEVFTKKMDSIKNKLMEHKYLKRLRELLTKNFNILLLGGTNVGKSTLINEFLKLKEKDTAPESSGGPTKTSDFKKYNGVFNEQNYTLYDTNGITNSGDHSIDNKIKNTEEAIKKRIKSQNPNELIHCIWYCIQGSNIQDSDGDFIKRLFDIYEKYNLPIIFVHTQTFSKSRSQTCKKGLKKILLNIYKNEDIVNSHLNNYIDILARKDDDIDKEPFGMDELEHLTRNEIRIKGHKSAFYEYIKSDIVPILINGAFKILFHDINLKRLADEVTNDINKYTNTMLSIINDEKFGLSEEEKNKNENSLNTIFDYFNKLKNELKDENKDLFDLNVLKTRYRKLIKEFYEAKSNKYKEEMNFETYNKNVEDLIFYNLNKKSNEILNNIINFAFNNAILDDIKLSIKKKFEKIEEKYVLEIYNELLKKA